MNRNIRLIILMGVLLALCLIFSYAEILVPLPVPIPGFRLGLSNLVIVFAIFVLGWPCALILGILKSLLMFLLFGNLFGLILSLCGFAVSFSVMAILKGTKRFSAVGISMAGGIFHNMGQLAGAFFLTGRTDVFRLIPVMSVLGTVTGTVIGFLSLLLIERFGKYDRICKG